MRKVPGADAVMTLVQATTGGSIEVMFLNAALFVRDKKAKPQWASMRL